MTPGPAGRKCTPYLLAGPGGMPLVLPLSEGLGSAEPHARQRWTCQGPVLHAYRADRPYSLQLRAPDLGGTCSQAAAPDRGQTARCWPRRPDEPTENPRFLRSGRAQCAAVAPSNLTPPVCHACRLRARPQQGNLRFRVSTLGSRVPQRACEEMEAVAALPHRGCSAHADRR